MIPVNELLLTDEDFAPLQDAFRSGWISSAGKYVELFESSWAAYCGAKHGVAVSNGTTALQTAVDAVGIGLGDEVIMPSFTIISCAMAVVRAGGVPVLVDSDADTYGLDVSAVAAAITSRTKAIMVVHIYGHPVDMDPIMALAARHHLVVIEDAAEAHGARYLSGRDGASAAWRTCGGIGHISAFSFFANKLVTTGEGGMVVTSDDELARRCRSLRNLCFRSDRRFLHTELGHQFRLTNLQAAVGIDQVKRIEAIVARKRQHAAAYAERLAHVRGLRLAVEKSWARNVYWVHGLLLDDEVPFAADEFAQRLAARGIETRPFFLGMHEQPVFHQRGLFRGQSLPVCERIARRGLYVPSGLGLTMEQIDRVAEAVRLELDPASASRGKADR